MKTLLIVESPAKSKTIEKLLGPDYVVKASFGHIRDLEKENLGIEVENGFRPIYKILPKSSKHIQDLKQTMERVDRVFLAADEDREGEAIAFHCAIVLKLNLQQQNRICFHEITREALQRAVENPRQIDMNMVNSQQARRILDRLIGFEISPIICRNLGKGSAGRVQSVCLKLIVDKENEILSFTDKKYFRTVGHFEKNIVGVLDSTFETPEETQSFLSSILSSSYTIEKMDTKRLEKRPPAPYTTSSIQQDIGSRFHIPSKRIMSILQNLYETGKITYHRTDSTYLSEHIMKEIKQFVLQQEGLGREYYHARLFKTKSKSAQEAHEAIRPTHIDCLTLDDTFEEPAKRIYEMIWKRTVASQMSAYVYDQMTITIGIQHVEQKFIAKAEQMIFDGYKKIYDDISKKENEENDEILSVFTGDIHEGETLRNEKVVSTEKYQSPPARFAEATIIKKMEVVGIGRPSTYANILDTLFERTYIEKKNIPAKKFKGQNFVMEKNKIKQQVIDIPVGGEKNKLVPTDLGKQTNEFLNEHFQNIVNTEFTSLMENKLDLIAQGNEVWNSTVQEYYQSFHPKVAELQQTTPQRPTQQKRLLGIHQNKNIYVYHARYGPVYQIGEDGDKEKKYVKLKETDVLENVTLEDFLQTQMQPEYPKVVGRYDDKEIMLKKGKFGFYLTYQEMNFKIKEGMTPEELTEEEAIQCILPNQTQESRMVAPRKCGKYKIAIGQYGPYVQLDSVFASIPNTMNLETMTEQECKTLIDAKKKTKKTFVKK